MKRKDESAKVTAEGEAYLSSPIRLRYVEHAPPKGAEAVAIAPGVRWCRIPLPVDLEHINVWLIDTEDGCVVVDTGMVSPIGEDAWGSLAAQLFASRPLRGVFVTHIHPDHIGFAHWLQQRFDVPVWMSARTHEQIKALFSTQAQSGVTGVHEFFRTHGVADVSQVPTFAPERLAQIISGVPDVTKYFDDGDVAHWGGRDWRALVTNGHADGHLCLHCEATGALISGDQVLPTISSNIGLTWHNRDMNPLGSYLSSLRRLHALPADTLVLPSHGLPFRGLQARIDDLRGHHLKQLDAVAAACAVGKTAVEVLPIMFRRVLKDVHFVLALTEAVAHLEYLVADNRVRRERDDAGITRYVARA